MRRNTKHETRTRSQENRRKNEAHARKAGTNNHQNNPLAMIPVLCHGDDLWKLVKVYLHIAKEWMNQIFVRYKGEHVMIEIWTGTIPNNLVFLMRAHQLNIKKLYHITTLMQIHIFSQIITEYL
jgi:hypothetical protein